ncbi:MAG: tryptophan-rich sensory protein [Bacilli bacterium]|nr:tryptophan-rich sensory protein [Bacilli bacterium]
MKKYLRLFLPLILGSLIGLLTSSDIDYNSLVKPPLSVPSIAFPIIWSILYLFIGITYYYFRKKSDNEDIIKLYYVQLFVNLIWPILFFTFKLRFISILWILLLDVLVALLIKKLEKNRNSFYLLIPYLLWTLFATYLNIGIYILN